MKEIPRKLVHISGLVYIPAYEAFGRETMVISVVCITAFAIILDVLRRRYRILPDILLRDYERKGVGAFVYFGIAMSVATVLFPKESCYVAIICGSLGDCVAGIAKYHFGLNENVASLLMFLSCIPMLRAMGLLDGRSVIATFAGVAVERVEKVGRIYINDNLSVPLVTAFIHRLSETVLF